MLKIRLARGGAKKRPFYHIVIIDSRRSREGKSTEKVGTYNPIAADDNLDKIVLKIERIQYWIQHGAQPTKIVKKLIERYLKLKQAV